MLDTLGNLKRTHACGELRASDAGKDVVLMGWVHRRRDLGQLIFIDLRDRAGIVQIVFNQEQQPEAHAKAEELRSEFVVAVEGHALRRQKANGSHTVQNVLAQNDLPTLGADEVHTAIPEAQEVEEAGKLLKFGILEADAQLLRASSQNPCFFFRHPELLRAGSGRFTGNYRRSRRLPDIWRRQVSARIMRYC